LLTSKFQHRNYPQANALRFLHYRRTDSMKNIIGTAVGAAIDRRDGDSGIKGAVLGYFASGAIKTVAKLGILAAIGAGAVGLAKRASR
jgi:hypothetical protein